MEQKHKKKRAVRLYHPRKTTWNTIIEHLPVAIIPIAIIIVYFKLLEPIFLHPFFNSTRHINELFQTKVKKTPKLLMFNALL